MPCRRRGWDRGAQPLVGLQAIVKREMADVHQNSSGSRDLNGRPCPRGAN